MLRKANKYIDWRAGMISGLIMGIIVFTINILATTPVDVFGSTTAGLKQAVYTVFIGGFLKRFSDWFALRPGNALINILLAALIPGGLASTLAFIVHSLQGTPRPWLSTLPVVILSMLIFPILATMHRKKYLPAATIDIEERPSKAA